MPQPQFNVWETLIVIQIVGRPKEDYVVLGFTNLLQEAFGFIQTLQLDIETRLDIVTSVTEQLLMQV